MRHLATAIFLLAAGPAFGSAVPYASPYTVDFSHSLEELLPDILHGPRAAPTQQSRIPFDQWYSDATRKQFGSWGPPGLHHPEPEVSHGKSADWKRQRVLAVALRYVGLNYQHHHLPDFDPPADWPWKEVGCGKNGRGVDCSNFTTFVYNLALGLKPDSGILQQSELREVKLSDGRAVKAERIPLPSDHADFSKVLRSADLLFIKNNSGKVSHVVLWVGPPGKSPDGTPLILDSTGEGRKDARGVTIPDGIQLRPFTKTGWYFKCASHALRLIPS